MRVLVIRIGAFGDVLITTPLVYNLKAIGHEVYYLTSEQGLQILDNNPNIDKIIYHKKDSIPVDKLEDYFNSLKQAYECDVIIDLCESVEVRLSLHPSSPQYKYTKLEKRNICNKNFYEETMAIAREKISISSNALNPFFYPKDNEIANARDFMSKFNDKKVIMWGMSGSARQKVYPYVHQVIEHFLDNDEIHFLTVGDEACQILEFSFKNFRNVTCLSGLWTMRESLTAMRFASLVVSPDTGLLHGSGCYGIPKIGLLTATTIENITKHFINDFSIEADPIGCTPCFSLIYDPSVQCNLASNKMPICMAKGISVSKVIDKIEECLDKVEPLQVLTI